MKFRKRIIEIEAMQWLGNNINEIWDWAGAENVYGPTEMNPTWLIITTEEGKMKAQLHDWVIKGIEGELYPCKPNIFEATYDPV